MKEASVTLEGAQCSSTRLVIIIDQINQLSHPNKTVHNNFTDLSHVFQVPNFFSMNEQLELSPRLICIALYHCTVKVRRGAR